MEPNQMNPEPIAPVQPQAPMAAPSGKLPTGVKIIGVLYYIGAAVGVLAAIAFFVGISFLFPGFGLGAIGGIIILVFAILAFFVARGIFRRKNWARIVVIVSSILGVIGGLTNLDDGGIVQLIINGLILWYLTMNANAKAAFKK